MKKFEDKIDFGPEVPSSLISKSLDESYGVFDPTQIKKNDFIVYHISQQINASNPRFVLEEAFQVISKDDCNDPNNANCQAEQKTDGFYFRLRYQTIDHTQSPPSEIVTDDYPIYVEESDTQTKVKSINPFFMLAETPKPQKITYHNFRESWIQLDPPTKVKASTNCGNIPNCVLRTQELQFDQVIWDNNNKPTKTRIIARVAPDLPFIARLLDDSFIPFLSYCIQQSVIVKKQAVLVTQCRNIDNYYFGQ